MKKITSKIDIINAWKKANHSSTKIRVHMRIPVSILKTMLNGPYAIRLYNKDYDARERLAQLARSIKKSDNINNDDIQINIDENNKLTVVEGHRRAYALIANKAPLANVCVRRKTHKQNLDEALAADSTKRQIKAGHKVIKLFKEFQANRLTPAEIKQMPSVPASVISVAFPLLKGILGQHIQEFGENGFLTYNLAFKIYGYGFMKLTSEQQNEYIKYLRKHANSVSASIIKDDIDELLHDNIERKNKGLKERTFKDIINQRKEAGNMDISERMITFNTIPAFKYSSSGSRKRYKKLHKQYQEYAGRLYVLLNQDKALK